MKSLFNRPYLPQTKLHASASMAIVVRLATEGIGIAVIPHQLVAAELRSGKLERIQTEVTMPRLSFCDSWLDSPDTLGVELVVEIAARMTKVLQKDTNKSA